MKRMYFKNRDTGAILTKTEYKELLIREYKEFWEGLDEEEKAEFGTRKNYIEYMLENDCDIDFVPVDKDGQDYWKDDYFWNDED